MEHIEGTLTELNFGETPMGQPRAQFLIETTEGQKLWGQTFGARALEMNTKVEGSNITLQGDLTFCDDVTHLDAHLLISRVTP